jgi:hypothetical protein
MIFGGRRKNTMTNKNADIDMDSGKFSSVGCLCLVFAIVLLMLGFAVSKRIINGEPILIIQQVETKK